jgi:hypothetical protein
MIPMLSYLAFKVGAAPVIWIWVEERLKAHVPKPSSFVAVGTLLTTFRVTVAVLEMFEKLSLAL